MIERLFSILVFVAALGSGVMAGVFFAFSTFVMPGLARLPASGGIAAMQSINIAAINPLFMTAFLGTSVLSAALAIIAIFNWSGGSSAFVIAGSLLYLLGILVVTMAFNVPLNNALAAVDPASSEGAALWTRYLSEWVAWNHVRTMAGIAALASFIWALR